MLALPRLVAMVAIAVSAVSALEVRVSREYWARRAVSLYGV